MALAGLEVTELFEGKDVHGFAKGYSHVFNALFAIGFIAPFPALAQTSGTWKTTGSLKTARTAHTATLLANGQVLVVGGENPMNLQSVKISACYESQTNPRGTDFGGAAFKDLVASVKEKGILVRCLCARKHGSAEYEVIAGSRRLRAAKEAGLKEIPAQIVDMNDTAAREQIVENLQRQDIHPLEEGEACGSSRTRRTRSWIHGLEKK